MGGYIGARSGTISATVANVQDVTATDSTPEVTIVNNTHEDTDGGREGKVIFKGQQSGGEESTLAEIQASHDGTADDEKADLIFRTNDGSDGASPTERVRIDSNGSILTATLGTDNVHLGEGAAASIASGGNNNVAIGKNAGTSISTGDHNTAVGYNSGDAITTSSYNTSIGSNAATAVTTGQRNTALGYGALQTETQGSRSTALGFNALGTQNTTSATDIYNVAIGYDAGGAITTGTQSTIVGSLAGDALTTGAITAVGYAAGSAATTSIGNVLMGELAGTAITTGNNNTAVGSQALSTADTGADNTCFGHDAGRNITTANQSTYVGSSTGTSVTTGSHNVLIGYNSGVYVTALTTGGQNTLVGSYTRTTAAGSADANGFGYDISADGGYTTVGRSTSDARLNHGFTTWATVSDERTKKDIADSTVGLSFVNALRPRTFNFRNKGDLPDTFRAYEEGSTEVYKSDQTQHGFIAQEVKTAIDAESGIKDGFKFWDERSDGSQEVAEAALIPVLVKAIQQLSAKVTTLETQNTTQATQIADLITRVTALEAE